jgi:signal transduction histidine kinase
VQRSHKELDALAHHLNLERGKILRAWKSSVDGDPELTTPSKISRSQFNDHIPQLLDAYEHRLRAEDPIQAKSARNEQREKAGEHGLLRWQQGYDQRESMREWGHLHLCVLRELEDYATAHGSLETSVMPTARAVLVRLCAEGVCESAARYSQMQQAEAAARVQDLQQALLKLSALERERGAVLREAVHDLRGTVGIISNASAILSNSSIEDGTRGQFTAVLARSVAGMRELLNDLIDLGRLEAGQERRNIVSFDAARMLRDLCDSMRVLSTQRNLFLKCQGPESLIVQGDPIKVRRVVQNLVLNALKVTQQGGVQVTWQPPVDGRLWLICIQDTGPGFDPARAAPLERALQHGTEESHNVEMRAGLAGEDFVRPAPVLESGTPTAAAPEFAGEGIGLSIVKRLCDLLDARLELETAAGSGTTFRILMPRDYGSAIQVDGSPTPR